MSKNKTWIWESSQEQGDFCDMSSKHEYQSGNLTDAFQAEAEAIDRGEEAVWWDSPDDQSASYNVEPGTQFNRWESTDDSQGVQYQRKK